MALSDGFHDVRFPVRIAFGSTGGPQRRTEIATLQSGHERRNARQAHARRRFDSASGIRSIDDLEAIAAFYEARRGELFAFRYRDPLDWKSCALRDEPSPSDQAIGMGDGVTTAFQLVKRYGEGEQAYVRPIRLPVQGSVRVATGGSELAPADFGVDVMTGTVTLAEAPGEGVAITAGFAFDIKARFASDTLDISVTAFQAGQIPSIPIVEVL